jgi:hypothetical protein
MFEDQHWDVGYAFKPRVIEEMSPCTASYFGATRHLTIKLILRHQRANELPKRGGSADRVPCELELKFCVMMISPIAAGSQLSAIS